MTKRSPIWAMATGTMVLGCQRGHGSGDGQDVRGLFGTWERIGKPVDVVWEGPAIQRDIVNPSKFYLWEDNYGGPGYSCFQTTDLYTIPYAACDPALSPSGMRHGAVVQVDQSVLSGLESA